MSNPNTVWILAILLAFVAGAVITLQFQQKRLRRLSALNEQKGQDEAAARERATLVQEELGKAEESLAMLREENSQFGRQLSEEKARRESDLKRMEEYREEIKGVNEKMTKEFELISHRMLEKNAESFATLSKENVSNLLNPFGEKLKNFEHIIRDTYEKGLKERSTLMEEVKRLHDTNLRLGEDAKNLTKALRGDSKTRGNWGELVLERVLERSGLRKGEEYTTQQSLRSDDNSRFQPDVVIHLPDQKHLIIDSKVSLVAYEGYLAEEDEAKREQLLKQHVQSVRQHIKELSSKGYHGLKGVDAPEFVLMFIPIEASFSLTIQSDPNLFQDAWQSKIVMVSPTTLLATLRTIASIWQHEKQTRNAILIAKEGGALIDKLRAIYDAVKRLGDQVTTVSKTQQDIMTKLDGRGGLIGRAQKLKELGAKSKKELPVLEEPDDTDTGEAETES